ncbi:GIY-YIG nuclease family protein [Breoghania sp. L-A4]|nr:GIY-YIG nuclease family protein [Breoghania sp. L-A4]
MLPEGPGAYVLLIHIAEPARIDLSQFSASTFAAGWYLYCGSAKGPGGMRARVARHMRQNKRPRWHVDRLTNAADAVFAVAFPDGLECKLVEALRAAGLSFPMPGFGATDCRHCEAHLLRWTPQD